MPPRWFSQIQTLRVRGCQRIYADRLRAIRGEPCELERLGVASTEPEPAGGEPAGVLTDEHHAVNQMISQGARFDQIEGYIDNLTLPGEHLTALWLLAWAEAADADTRRRIVSDLLAPGGQS